MTITKEQVLDLCETTANWYVNEKLQEWFPEAFNKDKETIEEAANLSSELQEGDYTVQHKVTYKHGFIDGAKWQQERNYNEEEVVNLLSDYWGYLDYWYNSVIDEVMTPKEWFNTLKK